MDLGGASGSHRKPVAGRVADHWLMGIAWDSHRALGDGDLSLSVRLVPLSGLCSAIARPALNPTDRHFAGLLPLSLANFCLTTQCHQHAMCKHALSTRAGVGKRCPQIRSSGRGGQAYNPSK